MSRCDFSACTLTIALPCSISLFPLVAVGHVLSRLAHCRIVAGFRPGKACAVSLKLRQVRYTAFTASRSKGTAFGMAFCNVTDSRDGDKRECYHDVMEKAWHLGWPQTRFD